jgi:hypothetical protein
VSVLSAPPTTTKYSFRRGDIHVGVWALQRLLNRIYGLHLAEDGVFGAGTEEAIKRYQSDTAATVDGIVGPQTQARIVRSCVVRASHGGDFPKGLIEGIIDSESGRLIAAVNASVPGGVDCGLTQRRVYSPYSSVKVAEAFDPLANVDDSAGTLWNRYTVFSDRVGKGEYAWRLAALAHNWPSAADQLSRGQALSTTRLAAWAPASAKFTDGAPVRTWAEWAQFYAMGSRAHNHKGLVTGLAFGLPTR